MYVVYGQQNWSAVSLGWYFVRLKSCYTFSIVVVEIGNWESLHQVVHQNYGTAGHYAACKLSER